MNRPTRSPVLAAALVLVAACAGLAGCGYVQPPALTIAERSSSDPFFTFTADELFAELAKGEGGGFGTTTVPSTYQASKVAQLLTGKVRPRILKNELQRRGVVPSPADRQLVEQAASQQQQSPPSEEQLDFQTDIEALSRVLAEDFFARPGNDVGDYARRYYEDRKQSFAQKAQTCLHIITVDAGSGQTRPTDSQYAEAQPRAQALRQRLNSEPFETVFQDSGQTTEGIPGGDVGCRPDENLPDELVEAMAAVPVGTTSQPLQWRAGWAIVRIDDRKPARTPPFEEVREQAILATRATFGQQFVNEVFEKANRGYTVRVDPRFGRWDAEQGQVLTPDGAAAPTIPTTSTTLPPLLEGPDENTPGTAPPAGAAPGTTAPSGTP